MVGIDSVRILLPVEGVVGVNESAFSKVKMECNSHGDVVSHKLVSQSVKHGLNQVEYDKVRGNLSIKASAKILGDDYRQSISLNTIDRVAEVVNSVGLVNVTTDQLLAADTLSCDPVKTVSLANLDQSVNAVLQWANMNRKYDVQGYTVNHKLTGFTASRRVKSYKERQIGYCKLYELTKASNKEFLRNHPRAVSSFGLDDLRIETNVASKRHMRTLFKTLNTSLGSILSTSESVNYDVFSRLIDTGVQMDLFSDSFIEMSLTDLVKEYGYHSIISRFKGDWARIEHWIKLKYPRTKTKNSAYYQIGKFREAFARYVESDPTINTRVSEIADLLKVA